MWSKLKKHLFLLLLLILSVSQGVSQGAGCWFGDLRGVISENPSTAFRNFTTNSNAFDDFKAVHRIAKENGLSNPELIEFARDIAKSNNPTGFISSFRANPEELIDAWKLLGNAERPVLKTNIEAIKALASIRKNPSFSNMGLSDEIVSGIQGTRGISYREVITNLDNLGIKASERRIDLIDFEKVVADIVQGGNKLDGANWITKYIGGNSNDFAGRRLKFEEYNNTELGGRFVDVTDITDEGYKIFLEFKSVSGIPPGGFQNQFKKDLINANNIDQIKWVFNPNKNPVGSGGRSFRDVLLKEIRKLNINDELAQKFLKQDAAKAEDLLDLIEAQFNNIFIK